MTLEEAIKHLADTLDDKDRDRNCDECRQEHEQLFSFLLELKHKRAIAERNSEMLKELEQRVTDCDEKLTFLKEMIQGKDQRIHFLLGQTAAYEKILFRLPWLDRGDD